MALNAKQISSLDKYFGTHDLDEIRILLSPAFTIPPMESLSSAIQRFGMSKGNSTTFIKRYFPSEYELVKPYQKSLGTLVANEKQKVTKALTRDTTHAKQLDASLMSKFGTTDILEILGPACSIPPTMTPTQRLSEFGLSRNHVKRWLDRHVPAELLGTLYPYWEQLAIDNRNSTNIERYGGVSPMCNKHVMQKSIYTSLKNRGYAHHSEYSPDEILRRLELQNLEPLEPITGYSGIHTSIRVRCKLCGKEFSTRIVSDPKRIYGGTSKYSVCECQTHGTQHEHFVRDYIRSLGYTCEQSRPSFLEGKEIDCFIPELNIGFEINGYYTHNSDNDPYGDTPKSNSYHKSKSELCAANGVKLYHIWHDSNTPDEKAKAKRIVDKALGIYSRTVYARNTKFEETTYADVKDFLNANHLHGALAANKYFKLTLNGETLSVMTFRAVTTLENTWELSRLATLDGVKLIGGSSKLFKHALPILKSLGVKQLISYAYRDFTPDPNNSVYTRLGFNFIGFTNPGLSYYANSAVTFPNGKTLPAGVYSRQKFMAATVKSEYGCTSTSDLKTLGLYRVFDSGNLKFSYMLN